MYKFMRYFNQNRKTIYKFILIIVFVLLVIKLFNTMAFQQRQNKFNNVNSLQNDNIDIQNTSVISNESAIGGGQVNTKKLDIAQELINKFINFCNERKLDDAYDLISEHCKEELFETIEIFKTDYYDVVFNDELRLFNMENWIGNTYKVDIFNDILSTGSVTDQYTDFITVVNQGNEDEYKLNIKRYIGKKVINKETETHDIKVKVLNKNIYMDYELYDIEIFNNSENDILMDTKDDTKTVYLKDTKGARYFAFTNEINDNELIVRRDKSRNIKLKFSNDYSLSRKIKNLIFSKSILNYNEYEEFENKDEYNSFYEFIINI